MSSFTRRNLLKGAGLAALAAPASQFVSRTAQAAPLGLAITTDFGNSAIRPLSWFETVKDLGYDGIGTSVNRWASTQYWPGCETILDRALTAGLWVFVYARPPEGWENGLNGLGSLARELKFFELDVEPESNGNHPVRQSHVDGLIRSDVRPVIYSNAGMWRDVQGYDDGVQFASVALHDRATRWTRPDQMTDEPLWDFAGWNQRSNMRRLWQYRDGFDMLGIGVTLQVVNQQWLDLS